MQLRDGPLLLEGHCSSLTIGALKGRVSTGQFWKAAPPNVRRSLLSYFQFTYFAAPGCGLL
jgi:hypothetical protein